MGKVKQIEIKNRTYYFYNDIINIEEFNSSLLKIDKKSYKDIDIYYIGYITIKKIGDYENIYSVNPLYLIIGKVDGHIEEKNESKYLVFDSTDENKEVLEKYTGLWEGIKNEIETILVNGGKKGEYGKDFTKIKFHTDDNLPLNKPNRPDYVFNDNMIINFDSRLKIYKLSYKGIFSLNIYYIKYC